MLPKPTNRMRAGNSTWTLCFWLMMDTDLRLRVAGQPKGINRLRAAQFDAAGRRRMTSARAPVRRIGAFVTGQGGEACEPAPERRIVQLDRHESRGELRRARLLERAFQQLDTREDDQIHRRAGISHDPFGLRQPPFDGARLARHRVHRRGDRVAGEIGAAGEHGFSNEVHVRLDVGLVLTYDAHDGARFLGRAPEERRLRVLEVEVVQDGKRLEAHVVAVPQHRDAPARVEREHLLGFVLLLGELQQVAHVRQAFVFKREQYPPRVRTAAAPENLDCHRRLARGSACDCNDNAMTPKMRHMATTLIEPAELGRHLGDADWAIVDCRFDLARPEWGAHAFAASHIPHALYAHLDHDLSAPRTAQSGRHPLPQIEVLAATLGRLGIDERVQVIAYDQGSGAFAARLWWLLRWLGHTQVAVLDGGLAAWERAGLPLSMESVQRAPRRFTARPDPRLLANGNEVVTAVLSGALTRGQPLLVD